MAPWPWGEGYSLLYNIYRIFYGLIIIKAPKGNRSTCEVHERDFSLTARSASWSVQLTVRPE